MNTATMNVATKAREAGRRVGAIDWPAVSVDLDTQGWAVLPKLLSAHECDAVAGRFDREEDFRSHVVMARHGLAAGGKGGSSCKISGVRVEAGQQKSTQSRTASAARSDLS